MHLKDWFGIKAQIISQIVCTFVHFVLMLMQLHAQNSSMLHVCCLSRCILGLEHIYIKPLMVICT